MDGPGLEVLARCVQSNVDQATFMHDAIVSSLEAQVARLEAEVDEHRLREWRMEQRLRWLLGYDEEALS